MPKGGGREPNKWLIIPRVATTTDYSPSLRLPTPTHSRTTADVVRRSCREGRKKKEKKKSSILHDPLGAAPPTPPPHPSRRHLFDLSFLRLFRVAQAAGRADPFILFNHEHDPDPARPRPSTRNGKSGVLGIGIPKWIERQTRNELMMDVDSIRIVDGVWKARTKLSSRAQWQKLRQLLVGTCEVPWAC